jgi:hypothetical protein
MTGTETTPMMPYLLGGRTFHMTVNTTIEQDLYIMQLVEDGGLQSLVGDVDFSKPEVVDVLRTLVIEAFARGQMWSLLGAVLEEDGAEWTIEGAEERAKFLKKLRTKEDKAQMHRMIAVVILGFFVNALRSYQNLGSFLSEGAASVAHEPLVSNPDSVSGTTSSESLPITGSPTMPAS